jgi:hypothetical protein
MFERRPVAQTFQTASGARFTVIANHFKSKGSCPASGPDTDQGDGQSCWNVHRTDEANELARWVRDTVVPAAGDPDVLLVGDLNSYAGEDPIAALESAGFTNLVKHFHGGDAYSYVFDSQWGYLDYVLASSSLLGQVTGAGDAHHNADEPSVLDYNTDFKSAGQIQSLYAPDRFRTSDHDPVLTGLDLGLAATVDGTPVAGTVGVPYSYTFTTGGTGSPSVSVVAGSLPPGLALSPSGTLTGTPTSAGDFSFTVRATNPFGSGDHAASVHIGQGASGTTLAVSPNPVATGASAQLSATVTGPVTPTGTVTFTEGATTLGTIPVAANGTATLALSLAVGHHVVVATYSGNQDLVGSTSGPTGVDVIDPVTIGTPLPGGTVGTAYSAVVPHTGGEPVTFAVTGASLPPGLTLSSSGTLSGTPTAAGVFAFTITATNPVSSASQAFNLTIAKAATALTLTSSANPATFGGAIRFTATISGNPSGGFVQFTVDGQALGGPVAVASGTATSPAVSSLGTGSHSVTAAYTGNDSYLPSGGSLTQVVWLGVRVISPASGARIPGGSIVPITFQLTDAGGHPIPHLAALFLLASGRVTVSATGAQSLPASTPIYDPINSRFVFPWLTARRHPGSVSVNVTITYPNAPTQVVSVPVTIT